MPPGVTDPLKPRPAMGSGDEPPTLEGMFREAYLEHTPEAVEAETSPAIEALDREQRQRRVLMLKGAIAVPLAVLVAIGGALLLHMLAIGGVLAVWFFGFGQVHGGSAGGGGTGGGGAGYIVTGAGPAGDGGLAGRAAAEVFAPVASAPPIPVPLPLPPELTQPVPRRPVDAVQVAPAPLVIGIGPRDLGTPRMKPPPERLVPQLAVAPPPDIPVAPPGPTLGGPLAMATGRSSAAGPPLLGAGNGGGNEDDDGPIDIMSAGYKGISRNSQAGDGMDRGPSGADNPSPQVLEQPKLELPISAQLHMPTHRAVFEVEVLDTGKIGTVTLKESSGNADVDDACRANILGSRLRPAYVAGKPVTRTTPIAYTFGQDQE